VYKLATHDASNCGPSHAVLRHDYDVTFSHLLTIIISL